MIKEGLRYVHVESLWGKLKLPKQRYYCKPCFHHERDFVETGMDSSAVLPAALERSIKLVTKVDFAEAAELLNDWGLGLSKSRLERLSQRYGDCAWEEAKKQCKELSQQSLSNSSRHLKARRFVIETDGCFVLERDKSETTGLEGREVKSLIIYPLEKPSKRVSLSSSVGITEFRQLAQGLLRQAGLRQSDICLGLGDGAAWVRDLLQDLGIEHFLLDVFHAVGYLDTLLEAVAFTDTERLEERKRWLRGQVNGAVFLQRLQASHNLTQETLKRLSTEAQTSWYYLYNHAQLGALNYPEFKAQDWVIASGQIEGYNKWAILERMRASGMHWSKDGLNRMAFLRSDFASFKPLTHFHTLRLLAFP